MGNISWQKILLGICALYVVSDVFHGISVMNMEYYLLYKISGVFLDFLSPLIPNQVGVIVSLVGRFCGFFGWFGLVLSEVVFLIFGIPLALLCAWRLDRLQSRRGMIFSLFVYVISSTVVFVVANFIGWRI